MSSCRILCTKWTRFANSPVNTGEAVCRGGQVLSTRITKDQRSIIEYEVPDYDEIAAAVKAHWDEGWSPPFPFPGDPGPG
jgi:hypothetical protein